ncbi:pyridoxine 5'-phosphate synthase, partial [Serratia symbiotica str. Tucson]
FKGFMSSAGRGSDLGATTGLPSARVISVPASSSVVH